MCVCVRATRTMDNSNDAALDWRMWCRLCAKEDIHSNIDVFLDEQDVNTMANVEHLFGVCIRQTEDLPHMLCTECYTLLTTLATFTERVSKVQHMFRTLQELDIGGHVDVHAVRTKFGLLDEEREHLIFMQPITEVQCYETKPKIIERSAETERQPQELEKNIKLLIKSKVKLEECLLEEEHDDDMIADEEELEEEEVAEDPFHNDDVDCVDGMATMLAEDDDDGDEHEELELEFSSATDDKQHKEIVRRTRQRTKRKHSTISRKASPKYVESDSEADESPTTKRNMQASPPADDAEAIYHCTDCPRKFKRMHYYRLHMKRTHSKHTEKPILRCDQCPRVFNTQCKLDWHVKAHLPLELKKVLPCPYCDKKYSTNGLVQSHIKCIHMNERPFICEECGIAVRTNSSLKSHMLTHTDSAPFICDVCNKGFKDHTRLKNHKEIHNPTKLICAECGLQLNSRSTLNRHLLVHSDEMKHKCDYCGRAFKRGKALKSHLILHTGLKPYSCDFCDRTFANGSNCRSHKKKAHPDELAALEAAGGGKTYTRNIPKLEALKAVTKAADNLTPVVSKQSGRFAFGKKPKAPPTKDDDDDDDEKSCKANKSTETHTTSSGVAKNASLRLGTPTTTTTTSIPTIDNIYSHILKHAANSDAPLINKDSSTTLKHDATNSSTSHVTIELSTNNVSVLQQQHQRHQFFNATRNSQHTGGVPATDSPNSLSSITTHQSTITTDGNSNTQHDERTDSHFYNQIRQNMPESYM